jgi:hypothetical protein
MLLEVWMGQRVVSGAQVSEETEACFALSLQEAFAHFDRRHARSTTETMIGSSDDGDAHTSIEIFANFGRVVFLPLRCEQGGKFLQHNSDFFDEETSEE